MKKVPKVRKNTKIKPVSVPVPYTLGLGYRSDDPRQSLANILGKHQARYMENIFAEMNKFTKTAVMTVVPDLWAQLLNVLKQEKQKLIAEALDNEAENPVDEPVAQTAKEIIPPAPLELVKNEDDGPEEDHPKKTPVNELTEDCE